MLGLVAGLGAQLIKLSSDAVVQRDIDETVRTRVFAWSETVLQIAWVVGGGIGIALPLVPRLGFGVISALLLLVLAASVRIRMSRRHHPVAARHPPGRCKPRRGSPARLHRTGAGRGRSGLQSEQHPRVSERVRSSRVPDRGTRNTFVVGLERICLNTS